MTDQQSNHYYNFLLQLTFRTTSDNVKQEDMEVIDIKEESHEEDVNSDKGAKCNKCKQTFYDKSSLAKHKNNMHNGRRQCPRFVF